MLDIFTLKNKVAVISGGSGLYGRQMVRALCMAGAKVYIASRNTGKNAIFASELCEEGHQVQSLYLDQGDEDSIQALCDDIYDEEGRIDILVNNAVLRTMKGYSDTKEAFEESMRVNATGLFLIIRIFGKVMCKAGKGSIINIGSYMGLLGPDYTLYEDTDMNPDGVMPDYFFHKGGMANYTRYIASHYGKYGVRCNMLALGGLYDGQTQSFVKRYANSTCLGRMANETDVMGGIIFLASDASEYITGATIPIDGGYTAK